MLGSEEKSFLTFSEYCGLKLYVHKRGAFFFFFVLEPHLQLMEVPGLGVESEL